MAPPLYRVSILDHAAVDYIVHFCGSGAVWCLERIAVVQFYEKRKPEIKNVKVGKNITARGFCIPITAAPSLGKRYECPTGKPFCALWNAAHQGRGKAGVMAERVFEWSVNNRFFAPTFEYVIRKATQYEDMHLGIDFFCKSDVADKSGVQVKWDSPAEHSGNLFVQIETEPVSHEWTEAPSGQKSPGRSRRRAVV